MSVTSLGGPLIVVPRSALPAWGGGDTDDYERACAVDGYVGLIPVGSPAALVLGDEPANTTYLPEERLFVRWLAAYAEKDLIDGARRAVDDGVPWDIDEDVRWVVDGPVVLFDAAWPGTELEDDNHLLIDPGPGTYRVRATSYTDGDTMMVLVQLTDDPDC
ncbi:Imm21 family immunity protein [Actinoplanes couchii]|uniref:Immunity protein 21 of polymorphic toxin system n=1 Tax=Actinoplanes couchii TaxID=403638 RepID=A0ABQ3XQT5_9ACTN|nr:Imm21 family immunity protein [Actinoplanes couchii]MDR6318833.1 hypothetical protein [Actinoplanes couchii]GID60864.1 hypothetical protein Aco03nite_092680 [Actinoplanes couchii]